MATNEEVLERLTDLSGQIAETLAVFAKERWWRRATTVLIVMGFLSTLGVVSYMRQADCDRVNRGRGQVRQSIGVAIGTTWDNFVSPSDPSGRENLLGDIDQDVAASLPPRDCAWPA